MGAHADIPLTLQACELLSQCSTRRGEPGLTTELLSLAVACHSRMLELGESDQPAAVELAIAGADLLQALAALEGPTAPLPAWAPIHEEQCCRYGALWIHSLLLQGHPLSQQRRQRCGELLNRLEQLHPEPVPWIATIRQALEPSCQAPEATSDLRLVVVGNCQAHPLLLGLQQALPQVRLHACPSVHLASHDDVTRLHRRLSSTDLLVMHRVQPGYRDGIGLDSDTLRALLPASACSVVLPSLHYEGHHPWIGYAQDPDDRLAALEPESPLGPYHDFLAMVAARDGLPLETLLDPACPPGRLDHLRHQHEQSLNELKNRESDCDLRLSDWLASQHRHRPLAHTINHPTQAALDQLLRRLLQHLGLPHQLGETIFDTTEYLGALSIPIHPWVRQALQLDSWADRWGQRQGNALPIEQQLQESIDFYRRHPWIAAANAQHPKLLLAEEVLNEAKTATTGLGSQSTPSIAALINYFNDEDMLAWQLKAGCLDHYDRIYIWDGPYGYLHRLSLFPDEAQRLDTTSLGQQLLADPRVVYRHRHWRDEAEKRIDAYAAVSEDLVVLHDTDEFFQLNTKRLQEFWLSPHAVAAQHIQNLYAGGLLGIGPNQEADQIEDLPLRRSVFRTATIGPERHLDYCWLVGVDQKPADNSLIYPKPLGHIFHLTACRTTSGQAAKMAYYMSLALSKTNNHPVVERLNELAKTGTIPLARAQNIFLRGDPGYAGVPHPAFGLRLRPRLKETSFPEDTLEAMLKQSNKLAEGDYELLSHYPLQLWIEAGESEQRLQLAFNAPTPLSFRSWVWQNSQPAAKETEVACSTSLLTLNFTNGTKPIGRLISLTIEPNESQAQIHTVQVRLS